MPGHFLLSVCGVTDTRVHPVTSHQSRIPNPESGRITLKPLVSILRHAGINFIRPGVDAAFHAFQILESLLAQEFQRP